MPLMMALACLASPGTALDSKFFTVTEKTLSLDLGPSFIIEPGKFNFSEDGIVIQEFLINNTDNGNSALVSVIGVYDPQIKNQSSDDISEIYAAGLILAMENNTGYQLTGNWTALNSQGGNVNGHSMARGNLDNSSQKTIDVAVWNLEASNYASIMSLLDRDNTTKIINTMTLA